MLRRSSKDSGDSNVAAFNIIRQATGETPDTGPEALAALIREIAGELEAGESPECLAERFWPRIQDMVQTGAAAALGSRGGKKGGKARAKKLSPRAPLGNRQEGRSRKMVEGRLDIYFLE